MDDFLGTVFMLVFLFLPGIVWLGLGKLGANKPQSDTFKTFNVGGNDD